MSQVREEPARPARADDCDRRPTSHASGIAAKSMICEYRGRGNTSQKSAVFRPAPHRLSVAGGSVMPWLMTRTMRSTRVTHAPTQTRERSVLANGHDFDDDPWANPDACLRNCFEELSASAIIRIGSPSRHTPTSL